MTKFLATLGGLMVTAAVFWWVGYYGLPQADPVGAGQAFLTLLILITLLGAVVFIDNKIIRFVLAVLLLVVGIWAIPVFVQSAESLPPILAWVLVIAVIPLMASLLNHVNNRKVAEATNNDA